MAYGPFVQLDIVDSNGEVYVSAPSYTFFDIDDSDRRIIIDDKWDGDVDTLYYDYVDVDAENNEFYYVDGEPRLIIDRVHEIILILDMSFSLVYLKN